MKRFTFKHGEGTPSERLQELENKIKVGKLLEAPCKIGDKFYSILDDFDTEPPLYKLYEDEVFGLCFNNNEWFVENRSGVLFKVGSPECILDYDEAQHVLRQLGCEVKNEK